MMPDAPSLAAAAMLITQLTSIYILSSRLLTFFSSLPSLISVDLRRLVLEARFDR